MKLPNETTTRNGYLVPDCCVFQKNLDIKLTRNTRPRKIKFVPPLENFFFCSFMEFIKVLNTQFDEILMIPFLGVGVNIVPGKRGIEFSSGICL